jgi:hypothetical protein
MAPRRSRAPLDATQNCFQSFSSGLLQNDIYRGLINDVGSVLRLNELAVDFSFRYGSAPASPLLDQLDLVISTIAVALLYAVGQICEYFCSQAEFSLIRVQLESRCRGMHSFGIWLLQLSIYISDVVSSEPEPGF